MHLDEKTLMLLQMIVLYSHDRLGLAEPEKVSAYRVGDAGGGGGREGLVGGRLECSGHRLATPSAEACELSG